MNKLAKRDVFKLYKKNLFMWWHPSRKQKGLGGGVSAYTAHQKIQKLGSHCNQNWFSGPFLTKSRRDKKMKIQHLSSSRNSRVCGHCGQSLIRNDEIKSRSSGKLQLDLNPISKGLWEPSLTFNDSTGLHSNELVHIHTCRIIFFCTLLCSLFFKRWLSHWVSDKVTYWAVCRLDS